MKKSIEMVFAILWVCFSLQACADEDVADQKIADRVNQKIAKQMQKELQQLEGVKGCDFSNITLLQLFEGYVPIPNMYYFSNRRSYDWANEFSRHAFFSTYTASMLMGEYDKLMQSSFSSIDPEIMHENYEERFMHGDLHVIKRRMKDVYDTYVVVIHDKEEFLMVKDPNEELWQAMLEGYDFLKRGECKDKVG